jgi:putative glutamine amidotransferase
MNGVEVTRMAASALHDQAAARRPLVGVMCSNEVAGRPVQVVASRFVAPLSRLSGAGVLLVPAFAGANEAGQLSRLLDGLLLTGSRSHVSPARYGGDAVEPGRLDEARDEVALSLAGAMVEAGKPVFGICRGFQEINVLFGGTLAPASSAGRHRRAAGEHAAEFLFAHRHDVALRAGGRLAGETGERMVSVVSVHEQGVGRLGGGLAVEAVDPADGLVEAVRARPCGGDVLAVQWHPEWDVSDAPASRAFFRLFGASLHGRARPCGMATAPSV